MLVLSRILVSYIQLSFTIVSSTVSRAHCYEAHHFKAHRSMVQLTISGRNRFPPPPPLPRVSLISLELSAITVNSVATHVGIPEGRRTLDKPSSSFPLRSQFIQIWNYTHWRFREKAEQSINWICMPKLRYAVRIAICKKKKKYVIRFYANELFALVSKCFMFYK